MPFYTKVTLNLFQVKKEKERERASQEHTCPIKKLKHQILMCSKQKLKQLADPPRLLQRARYLQESREVKHLVFCYFLLYL